MMGYSKNDLISCSKDGTVFVLIYLLRSKYGIYQKEQWLNHLIIFMKDLLVILQS